MNGIQEVMGSNPTISILEVSGFIYFLVAERFKPTKDVFGWFYFWLVLFLVGFILFKISECFPFVPFY